MIKVFILIVLANTANVVTFQEFNSKESCFAALRLVDSHVKKAYCVEK